MQNVQLKIENVLVGASALSFARTTSMDGVVIQSQWTH